jgi:hypothetical protein
VIIIAIKSAKYIQDSQVLCTPAILLFIRFYSLFRVLLERGADDATKLKENNECKQRDKAIVDPLQSKLLS